MGELQPEAHRGVLEQGKVIKVIQALKFNLPKKNLLGCAKVFHKI